MILSKTVRHKAKNFHISRFFTESAIEAMEEACRTEASDRESCDDAISRRAVLDTLNKMDSALDEDRTVETYKELLTACYKDLPSVTPEHKKEWIPVSERLPELPGIYMTTLDYGKHGLATGARYYHGKYFKWMNECVVAWIPLPEPYKAETEGEE